MALLWFDGFESYAGDVDMAVVSGDFVSHYSSDTWMGYVEQGAYGRRGSRGIQLRCMAPGGDYYGSFKVTLSDNYVTILFGIAVYVDTAVAPTYHSSLDSFAFWDESVKQLKFHIVGTELQVRRGDDTLLGTTSGAGISYQVWKYLEIKVTIDSSSGIVVVKTGGQEVLSLSGINTQNTANAYTNGISFKNAYDAKTIHVDDLYICDITGTKNNDFLGDVRVDVLRPDGEGTYNADFTGSPDVSSNLNVDEITPDDDTTYNTGSTPGDKDSYALASLSALGTTIHGVKSQITVKKTDAGSMNAKILTRAGTTDDLSDSISLGDSFTTHTRIHEDNPDDDQAWEEADVNAMEVGIELATTTTTSTSSSTTTTS